MTPVLAVRDVQKAYATTQAVDRLSFDVRPGEIFALLGPNGAGKSTMVRALLGIVRVDSGSIEWSIDGAPGRPAPAQIGYLPEERGLYKDVPVLRMLSYFGVLRGMRRVDARAEAERWLEKLDLTDRAKDKVDSLSKGNQQKVQFAAAVLHKPAFAVLDEPFSGFDPINQEAFSEHIREMRDGGATVLLSAHQMQLVERIADRMLLIDRGREVLSGSISEVRDSAGAGRQLVLDTEGECDEVLLAACPGVLRVRVCEPGRIVLSLEDGLPLNATLQALGELVAIRGVHDERPSLHDIYVDAVRERAVES